MSRQLTQAMHHEPPADSSISSARPIIARHRENAQSAPRIEPPEIPFTRLRLIASRIDENCPGHERGPTSQITTCRVPADVMVPST